MTTHDDRGIGGPEFASAPSPELLRVMDCLLEEFASGLPTALIISKTVMVHDRLRESGVQKGLIPATEALTREYLTAMLPTEVDVRERAQRLVQLPEDEPAVPTPRTSGGD